MSEETKDNLPQADGNEEITQISTPLEEQKSIPNNEEKVKDGITDELQKEIDDENAEDAEDSENAKRHEIPMLDYEAMPLEALKNEFKRLLHTEKVQAIKRHMDTIRYEFDKKYADLLEEKKDDFLSEGGSEIDFKYNIPVRSVFYDLYNEYKNKRNQYYKDLETNLQANLARRQDIIQEIKSLINTEEDINTTYKTFKQLQEQWRIAGAVPRANYNDLWQNYHHHVENFYDFLDLNRDLRDMDFRHNLEEKLKIVEKAEALQQEEDVAKAFRELQVLHKIWKEDIGPVDREHREEVWQRFSSATKAIHERKQAYYKEMDVVFEKNLSVKNEIIEKIKSIANREVTSHHNWQKAIKEIETLREEFFSAGKVSLRLSEEVWHRFKEATRSFNRQKNNYYKNLKKEQQENLDKKLKLIEIANTNKDSEDWDATTPVMRKIQEDWKEIGHVPRKYANKIWKEFKEACNQYFDRLHKNRKLAKGDEYEALDKKKAILDKLKEFQLTENKEENLSKIKEFFEQWNVCGRIPYNKRSIDTKFNKIIDKLYQKMNFDKQEVELLRYNDKLEQLANEDSELSFYHEVSFVKRKIEEIKSEVLQLENNLQFFNNIEKTNPLVRDVYKKIDQHKEALNTWKAKLHELKNLQDTVLSNNTIGE